MTLRFLTWACLFALSIQTVAVTQDPETLPRLSSEKQEMTWETMWSGFDPRREPLEVEVIKEWQESEVTLRIVRFRIGVFKGQVAKLAAIYGFPTSSQNKKLPGLVQIHGGGQYADYRACLVNAQRGYATVSISWAGRINAPGYNVTPAEVKLFWDAKVDDPRYRLITDWGKLDGYHAPGRNQGNQFPSIKPAAWTLDMVESPRNSGWFLAALAARRAITFLEKQPEVDPNRIGVYGHSMGGKLTVLSSIDKRVKAAAPSCGGISDRYDASAGFRNTLGDNQSLQRIDCPIIFLSPANDFHGRIGDLPKAINEIESKEWRVVCSPHHNHQDTPEFEVATMLWFDQHLKNSFKFPNTPKTELKLSSGNVVPILKIAIDQSLPVQSVDVFYTRQGRNDETPDDMENTKHRYWRHAKATEIDGDWTANVPLDNVDQPLWIYANVQYELRVPVEGAGYYYRLYKAESFVVSSLLTMVSAKELRKSGVKPVTTKPNVIEDFEGDWRKEWFTYRPESWPLETHKVASSREHAISGSRLSLEVRCRDSNQLVVLVNEFAAMKELKGENEWQKITFVPSDFQDFEGEQLANWNSIKRVKLSTAERLRPGRKQSGKPRLIGKPWVGTAPEFRNLRWE